MPPTGTALQRLKDARIARQQAGITGQRQHFAASSDADNEAYMQNFEEAFSSLTALPGWRVGPVDAAGVLVQLSDRPLMCSAANWDSNEVIIGSSDHASYGVDAAAGKKRRTLYSKTTGHTEWVTSVCCLPGGRVLSGGMDGRLYDKTVKVWDVSDSRAKQQAVLQGHTGPVLEMAVHPAGSCIVTGDRKGGLMCWDLEAGSSSWGVAAAHQGHITALAWSTAAAAAANTPEQHLARNSSSCCVISGGQDGVVRVWDGRTGSCSAEQAVHADKQGKGAVGNIVTGLGSSGNLVVTAGADMTLRILDAAQAYKPIHTVQLTDFPYSLTAAGADIVLCGCGDGSVHVVDVEAGAELYALGAGRAAVRAMEVSPGTGMLVCAGDDGCVVCYEFKQAATNKRKYSNASEGEQKLRLRLACTTEPGKPAATPLDADEQLVRLLSLVARALPEGGEWDLSGLLLDGQPVSRAVVVAWLNAAYQQAYGEDFEAQEPDQDPACSVQGLYMLLSFADAVDSTKPLLRACCSQLQRLQLHAQLGQQQVGLDTSEIGYFFHSNAKLHRQPILTKPGTPMPAAPDAASAEQQAAFKQQVAAQTEQLLWLAHRLQLQPLVQHMHSCVWAMSFFPETVLQELYDDIFTPRVLEAAGVASLPGGRQMLINSVRGELLTLADSYDFGPANLRPIGLSQEQQQPLKFNAVVACITVDNQGATIAVELDLFGESLIKLGDCYFPVQLRIGPHAQ
ncbi:hypothetical protein OEZ86_004815 [Tetradesmus obliquus]|nr:hypothetical protein OEZ86_004815 [Tetradesmus obliquus]